MSVDAKDLNDLHRTGRLDLDVLLGFEEPLRPRVPVQPLREFQLVEDVQLTDVGNARRLAKAAAGDLRWSRTTIYEGWSIWNGRRWTPDAMLMVQRRAKGVAVEIRTYALMLDAKLAELVKTAGELPTEDQKKEIARLKAASKAHHGWALKSESARAIHAMIGLARDERGIGVAADQWDSQNMLLATPSGTFELETGKLRDSVREDYNTKETGAPVGKADACPTWLAFLHRIMGGDEEMIGYLQRWCGYCLTGSTAEQAMVIMYGNGANGKSTFIETIRYILGDYAKVTRAETMMAKKEGGVPNDIAALAGARLVTVSESDQNARLNEGLIKSLTGGDQMAARFMRGEFFEFTPRFKVMIATNHRPAIRGTDEGIWRRLHMVPFGVTIPKEERDGTLPEKLRAEAPAILAWMIEGCQAWQRGGLRAPKLVRAASEEYRKDQDQVGLFIDECCIKDEHASLPKDTLYKAYSTWCEAIGERPMAFRTFGKALVESKGWRELARKDNGRRWEGWKINYARVNPDHE
jgi:putative DNA primase/helicase